jgi:tripartite-type tricarboxylate transporter receptor subunit TctC
MIKFLRAAFSGLLCLVCLATAPAAAADYPNRPVRWLIGFAPGGPVDIVARIMAQWLSDRLGQQFVVENRAGSGGNLAAAAAVNSEPDGYTLLFVAPNNAISASLYKKLPYDFIRDTVPVAGIMRLTNMMVVPTTPYRGSALAYPDLMSNKVQTIFDNLPGALEQVRAGTLRALGVTSPQRWPGVPDVPAIAETVPGFESVGFYGISAPKGTPPEIVALLNKAVGEALKDPKLAARLAEVGGLPMPMTPPEFGKLIADETEKWRKVVEFAGVSVD